MGIGEQGAAGRADPALVLASPETRAEAFGPYIFLRVAAARVPSTPPKSIGRPGSKDKVLRFKGCPPKTPAFAPDSDGKPSVLEREDTGSASVPRALRRAVQRLKELQQPDGHWAGDYGGPLFLLPGLVIAYEVIGARFTDHQRERMITYLANVQNADGGYGLHVEDRSTMLGSTLNYVALRLPRRRPGRSARGEDAPLDSRAWWRRASFQRGAEAWFSVLGVYEWEGVSPLLPELWLLPRALPMHPSNLWCHTRAVFLAMSYLYGRRAKGPETDAVRALREELYVGPYDAIDWPSCRSKIHPLDAYSPHSRALDTLNRVLGGYVAAEEKLSRWGIRTPLRERALRFVIDQIHREDESTAYLDIGPVSKAFHIVCVWFEDPKQPAVEKHLARVADYLWDGSDGMKMQGYNGSQFWDLAFTMQAVYEAPSLFCGGAREATARHAE